MKIDKWFSNLRIRNRILLVFSTEIIFWLAICALSVGFMQKIIALAVGGGPPPADSLNGVFISFLIAALVLSLIFALLMIYLTSVTIKSIVEPIDMLSKAACLISEGVLDGSVSSNRQDEIGSLARSMDKLLTVLRSLCVDLKDLTERHGVAGDVYAKIDAEKYDGDIKEAVGLVNAMLWQYIADARDVLYCISEFARGNFNTQLRSFPGMRSVANNISDGLRKELASLTKEMGAVVSKAADGNFEFKLKDTEFSGEWGMVARELNRLLDTVAASIRETTDAMLEIFEGNLNPSIKGEFVGDFALIKTSAANAVESVFNNINDISEVLSELSNGNAGIEIKGEFSGDYANAGKSLGMLTNSIKRMMSETDVAANDLEEYSGRLTEFIEKISSVNRDKERMSEQITELFSSFGDFESSTYGMSKIVELMEDVSHQTSLLALTASVETARAGERGRGFALVTEEINNLAERNNEAIGEVENILNASIEKLKEREERLHVGIGKFLESSANNDELAGLMSDLKGLSDMPRELSEHSQTLRKIAAGLESAE